MTDKRLALSTAGSEDEARKIAEALVERRLAACVNLVGPISSIYRWEGKVQNEPEYLLLIKTTAAALESVHAAIRELHSYRLPEFIVLDIDQGSTPYLQWIAESVG